MTIQRFQSIVLRLASQMPVRYFLSNRPSDNPCAVMQIQFYFQRAENVDRLRIELKEHGLRSRSDGIKHGIYYEIWEVDRTTESGEPYVSLL